MTTSPVHRVQARIVLAAILLLCAAAVAAAEAELWFDIPAQPADVALREFARQSGQQLIFSFALTEGRTTPAILGRYTPLEAATRLAHGLGLKVVVVDERNITLLAADAALVTTLPAEPVKAPDPGQPDPVVRPPLQEIFVTAQKRSEAAQLVPVSMDIVVPEALSRETIRDIRDLQRMSTKLEIDSMLAQATVIGLRGLQQQGFAPTGDTLTAVHLDGVFLPSFWGLNGLLYDLERVEVLAGPQGTLYGRNTAAGTVNLVTTRPGRERVADATLEAATEGTRRLNGGVTVPMGASFSMRLAGHRYSRDALFTDGGGERDQWGARLSAIWRPHPAGELFLTADHADIGGTNDSTTLHAVNAAARLPDGSVPASVANFLGNATLDSPYDTLPYLAQRNLVFFGENEQRNHGFMAQYTHQLDEVDAVMQYSHRKVSGVARSATRTPAQLSGTVLPNVVTSDTAEIRFASRGEHPWSWVGGAFYMQAENVGWNATPLRFDSEDPVTGKDVGWCPCSSGFFPNSGNMYSWAVFGQGTWRPDSSRLRLTAGLRYTFDWKDATLGYWVTTAQGPRPISGFGIDDMPDVVRQQFAGVPDIAQGDNDRTWQGLQYRLGVDYQLTEDSMAYLTLATGYKSGGLTYGTTPQLRPEDLLAIELGMKNRFLEDSLEFNASAWFYDYTDLEANVQRPLGVSFQLPDGSFQDSAPSTASVGEVYLAGISADLTWNFTLVDQLGLSVTHVYSRIEDGDEITAAGSRRPVFNEGERLGDAPRWQLLGRYSHAFAMSAGILEPELKYMWQSGKYDAGLYREQSYFVDNRSAIETRIPARGVLDLSVRFAPRQQRWELTAYVTNVLDELVIRSLSYNANPANAATNFGHTTAALGDPRMMGLIWSTRFQ